MKEETVAFVLPQPWKIHNYIIEAASEVTNEQMLLTDTL